MVGTQQMQENMIMQGNNKDKTVIKMVSSKCTYTRLSNY
jgi:hypothetical protein